MSWEMGGKPIASLKFQLHVLAEWGERKTGHLEMLFAPRNTDNRDAQEQAEKQMHETSPQSSENQPEQIQRDTNATCWAIRVSYRRAKRPQAEHAYLESL